MTQAIKLLLVEDEVALGEIIKESLETRDFEVAYCQNGVLGWERFKEEKPDVCILDVMMPLKDGFTLAEEIRKVDEFTPIIFLTAKSQIKDVVKGFEIGANDYLKKPFKMEELIVRIKALLRDKKRYAQQVLDHQDIWNLGQFTFNYPKQLLIKNHKEQKLTHREAAILNRLCQYQNQVMERKPVLLELWGDDSIFNARSMDVFITKLRKYLKQDPTIEIVNVRGVGYKLIC